MSLEVGKIYRVEDRGYENPDKGQPLQVLLKVLESGSNTFYVLWCDDHYEEPYFMRPLNILSNWPHHGGTVVEVDEAVWLEAILMGTFEP